MVLEALESIESIKKNSITVLLVAVVLSAVSIVVAYNLFPDSTGVYALSLITIAMIPVLHTLFSKEEEDEVDRPGFAPGFIVRHFSLIKFYSWFFIGLVASYALWFVILPPEVPEICGTSSKDLICMVPPKSVLFKEQMKQFSAITGNATGTGKAVVAWNECKNPDTRNLDNCRDFIFSNNSFVMGLSVLLSFAYGAGAIELIGWNASVVGTFVGQEIARKDVVSGVALAIGYLPHGIFEIAAYFLGAIAGGIISTAISRRKYRTHEFEIIAKDVLAILILAYILLYIGAWIESSIILGQVYL